MLMEFLLEYFSATLTSKIVIASQLGATIDGYALSTFNGNTLQPRYLNVNFIKPSEIIEGSTEPLGVGRN